MINISAHRNNPLFSHMKLLESALTDEWLKTGRSTGKLKYIEHELGQVYYYVMVIYGSREEVGHG